MMTEIVKEANLTGAKEEKLPYPMGNLPLSKKDCAKSYTQNKMKQIKQFEIVILFLMY